MRSSGGRREWAKTHLATAAAEAGRKVHHGKLAALIESLTEAKGRRQPAAPAPGGSLIPPYWSCTKCGRGWSTIAGLGHGRAATNTGANPVSFGGHS